MGYERWPCRLCGAMNDYDDDSCYVCCAMRHTRGEATVPVSEHDRALREVATLRKLNAELRESVRYVTKPGGWLGKVRARLRKRPKGRPSDGVVWPRKGQPPRPPPDPPRRPIPDGPPNEQVSKSGDVRDKPPRNPNLPPVNEALIQAIEADDMDALRRYFRIPPKPMGPPAVEVRKGGGMR